MKSVHFLIFILVICTCAVSAQEIQGKILKYGIFKSPEHSVDEKAPDAPGGAKHFYEGFPIFTSVTDKIPAKPGIHFGIIFEISNLPDNLKDFEFIAIQTCPPIHRPNGTVSTGYTQPIKEFVKEGRVVSWTGYSFDHDYELVPGEWTFEIKSGDKTLCKQTFTVTAQ